MNIITKTFVKHIPMNVNQEGALKFFTKCYYEHLTNKEKKGIDYEYYKRNPLKSYEIQDYYEKCIQERKEKKSVRDKARYQKDKNKYKIRYQLKCLETETDKDKIYKRKNTIYLLKEKQHEDMSKCKIASCLAHRLSNNVSGLCDACEDFFTDVDEDGNIVDILSVDTLQKEIDDNNNQINQINNLYNLGLRKEKERLRLTTFYNTIDE